MRELTRKLIRYTSATAALLRVAVVSVCLGAGFGAIQAQAPPIEFELKTMSEGSYTAFTTEVEGASEKLALREWRDLMKEYGAKTKRSKPERVKVEEVVITSIGGSDALSIYADFDSRGSRVKIMVWIKQRGEFLGEASGERDVENATALLQEFSLRLRRAAIDEELADEQRALDKIEKKLKKLESDLDRYERTIERAREQIVEAEDNIVKNTAEQESTRLELERQAENVSAVQEKRDGVKG